MANTEDYLDSLLNSINNTNMSGKKSKSYSGSDPYDNASEAFRKFEREQEYKREQRKKREEEQRFLQEFEGELEQEDVDDFLRQFELELAEEEENEANESVNTQSSVDENAGNIADMVSNAVENSTAGSSATSEQTVSGDTQAAASADNAEFFENLEEIVSDASANDTDQGTPQGTSKQGEMSGVSDEGAAQEAQSSEPEYVEEEPIGELDSANADLLELLNGVEGDADLSEIGDLLNADSNDITLQETGAAYDEGVKAASSGSAATGTKEKADDEKKKPKKKKGFFAKLAATLFGEEEESTDVEHVEVPESRDLENISDENLQILKELEAAEQAGAAKEDKKQAKKDKKKAKKEKKEKEPKEKKPRKKREKKVKEPKPEEPDNTPPLPKKPVILIFLMAFSILALVLLMMKLSGKNSYIDTAKQAMDNGEYVEAYEQLSGLNLKGNDQKLYEEVSTMAAVQEQYQAYLTLMGADKYDLALDALVRGIGRYDKGLDNAKKYGREGEMNHLKDQLEEALDQQFGMSTDDARKLYKIKDREEYSKEIQKIIQKMNLGQEEK